jgi:hypothetical protein
LIGSGLPGLTAGLDFFALQIGSVGLITVRVVGLDVGHGDLLLVE